MYVDLGKQRGRVHFTWRDLALLWALFTAGVGYVVRSEIALSRLRFDLAACQESVKQLGPLQSPVPNQQHARGRVQKQPPHGD